LLHMPDRGGLRNLYIFCSVLALVSAGLCVMLIKREARDKANGHLTAAPQV